MKHPLPGETAPEGAPAFEAAGHRFESCRARLFTQLFTRHGLRVCRNCVNSRSFRAAASLSRDGLAGALRGGPDGDHRRTSTRIRDVSAAVAVMNADARLGSPGIALYAVPDMVDEVGNELTPPVT